MNNKTEQLLIDAIRKQECLWNTNLLDYKDAECRRNAWQLVNDELNLKEGEAEKKWKSLRTAFVHNCKKLSMLGNSSAQLRSGKVKWKHFEQMLFLKDHVDYKKSSGNVSDNDNYASDIEGAGGDLVFDSGSSDLSFVGNAAIAAAGCSSSKWASSSEQLINSNRSRKRACLVDDEQFHSAQFHADDHFDADLLFVKSIVPSLRVIAEEFKDEAKIELLQVIQKYKKMRPICHHRYCNNNNNNYAINHFEDS